MKRILNRYELISGQVVNLQKSVLMFSPNTTTNSRKEVCDQLGVREDHTLGKYLGMPMSVGRSKVAEFGFILDWIEQKL